MTETQIRAKIEAETIRVRKVTLENIQNVPDEFKAIKQWVVYRFDPRETEKGSHVFSSKLGKPPVSPLGGNRISKNDPKNFLSFDRAVNALKANKPGNLAGIGLVFTGNEPFSGVDIDSCIDQAGHPTDHAQEIIDRLKSYTEVSPSGTGLRIIGVGKLPTGDNGGKCGNYEVYCGGTGSINFLTMTGNVFGEKKTIREFSSDLAWFRKTYATSKTKDDVHGKGSPCGLQETRQSSGPLSDEDILKIISKAKNSAKVQELISNQNKSEDLAGLVNCLVFYSKDTAQVERIIRTNCKTREKWDEKRGKDSFLTYEIKRLLAGYKGGSYEPKRSPQREANSEIDPEELKRRAEAVLTNYSNPCGTFDTSTLPEIIREYVDHICATTDAEPITVTSSVLGLISGFLKKHVYIMEDDYKKAPREVYFQRLYANLNMLNVLESGLFKTTALNKGRKIGYQKLDEIRRGVEELKKQIVAKINDQQCKKKKLEDSEDDKKIREKITKLENQNPFLPEKATAEGLLEIELGTGRAGTIFLSEFGAWLKNLQKTYNIDLKALFTDIYDVPKTISITTKGTGRIMVERPFVSICGVSTIDWVKDEIKPSDISSGFFARFLIFNPPSKKVVPPAMPVRRQGMNQEIEGKIKEVLFNRIPEDRPYVLSVEAFERFNAIHAALYESFDELPEKPRKLLEPYIKRWSPYILKLAMIMQFMTDQDTNEIGVEAIMSGAAIVEYAIKSTTYLFQKELGESKHQENCRKLLEFIAKRTREGRGTTWSNILSSHLLEGGTKEYDDVVKHLVEAGKIDEIVNPKKCFYRYILKDGCES